MPAPGTVSQLESDASRPPPTDPPRLQGRDSIGRPIPRRRVYLWTAVGVAVALTVTATLAAVPLSWTTSGSGGFAFLELKVPANGTIPGRAVLPVSSGAFCAGPPHGGPGGGAGMATFTLQWATHNGTRLSHFDLYVPNYMGIAPGLVVYSVSNASQGNFSQQVQGPGALCHWAMDFEATFATYDGVDLFVHSSATYNVLAPLL